MKLLENEEEKEEQEELKKNIVKTKSMIEAHRHEELVNKIGENSGVNTGANIAVGHINVYREGTRSKSKGASRERARSKSRSRNVQVTVNLQPPVSSTAPVSIK